MLVASLGLVYGNWMEEGLSFIAIPSSKDPDLSLPVMMKPTHAGTERSLETLSKPLEPALLEATLQLCVLSYTDQYILFLLKKF